MSSLQPWQGGQPQRVGQSGMRASNADRERTVDVLKAAYAEGRLTPVEYEERMSKAYQSSTYGELTVLISDLPSGPLPGPQTTSISIPPVPQTFLPPPPRPTNASAVGALVCGLAAPILGITAIPAVVLGHTAKNQIRQNNEEGDGMANVGLVLGWLCLPFWALFWFLIMMNAMVS